MQQSHLPDGYDVERWNDRLAQEHDIDDYYARSSPIIRVIEERRLAIIRRLIAPAAGERLLEVGCGGGHVLARFPECRLFGVDVSGDMLEKARRRLAHLGATLLKGELGSVDLEPGSFDAVICTEVLEHVVEPEAVLAGIARMLSPSGRAVITFPNDHLINGAKGLVKRSGLAGIPPFSRISWGGEHFHFHVWTLQEMRELLARYFRVEAEDHAPARLFPVRCCFLVRPRG